MDTYELNTKSTTSLASSANDHHMENIRGR
jgi:hypothetical protein